MAFDKETFVPRADPPSRAEADVEIMDKSLSIQGMFKLPANMARFGGCLVTKDQGTQIGVSPATEDQTTGQIMGMTFSSVQDLEPARFREDPNSHEKHLGSPPGIVTGRGSAWISRYVGTVLPGTALVVGPSGYPKASTGTGIIVGVAYTSGVGDVDGTSRTPVLANWDFPATGSGLVGS